MKKIILSLLLLAAITIQAKGSFEFTVKDVDSYERLANSIISLKGTDLKEQFLFTDAYGKVRFEGAAGRYDVLVKKNGYDDHKTYFFIEDNKHLNIEILMDKVGRIALMKDNYTEHTDKTCIIKGFVRDAETGTLLKNIAVAITSDNQKVTTNEKGEFSYTTTNYKNIVTDTDIPVYTNLIFSAKNYTSHKVEGLLLTQDVISLKVELKKKENSTVSETVEKIDYSIFADPLLKETQATIEELSTNNQLKSTVANCTPAATIKVGTSCSCATCSGVSSMSMESYVQTGVDNEWISSWKSEAIKSGTIPYRTYGTWYTLNPYSSNYDIANTPCHQAWGSTSYANCVNAAVATSGEMLSKNNAVPKAEYSAENNGYNCGVSGASGNCNCGDGYAGSPSASPCIADGHCAGKNRYGHGRGMCQWGTQRWALNDNKTYTWIVDHYYTPAGVSTCASSCIPPGVPSLNSSSFGNGSCPGLVTSVMPSLTWVSNSSPLYLTAVRKYPFTTTDVVYYDTVCTPSNTVFPTFNLEKGMIYRWWAKSNGGDCTNPGCFSASTTALYFYTKPSIYPPALPSSCTTLTLSTNASNVGSSASVLYNWYNNGSLVKSSATDTTLGLTGNGKYHVEIVLSGSTISTCTQTVMIKSDTVTVSCFPVGINDVNSIFSTVAVYPNPLDNGDHFTIQFTDISFIKEKTLDITLFSYEGKRVYTTQEKEIRTNTYNLPTKGIANGIYILELKIGGQTKNFKLSVNNK